MIRNATPQDQELLADIIRRSFSDVAKRFSLTRDNCPKHPSNCTPSWIASDMARGVRYFILYHGQNPIGCAGVEYPGSGVCYLERLSIVPRMRGRRFGLRLVRHALELAASKGAAKVGIGIIAAHGELKAWYEGIGFVETGRKIFDHLPFEVSFMEIDLNAPPG